MDTLETGDSIENLPVEKKDNSDALYDDTLFPSLVTRIKALFIDLGIMLIIFTLTSVFIASFGDIPNLVKGLISFFMFYLYDPLLTSFTGSTLGHKLMKLKVRRYNDPEKNISLGQAFLRFIIKGLLGWISFLTVTSNKRKRAIHDIATGSIILPDNYSKPAMQ